MYMEEIGLSVLETTEHGRHNWYVSSGVPFPKGALASEEHVLLIDSSGEPVIAQFDPLAQWEDGSVKWLLVTFTTHTEAGASNKYRLRYGNDVQPATWEPAFQIGESGNQLRVSGDVLRFDINIRRFNLLERFGLGDEVLLDNRYRPRIALSPVPIS